MNGDVQSDLYTLAFKNEEKLEYFHSRIIRLLHEIILSGETVSLTRLLFQYMKAILNSYKPKAFIAPKVTYIITFLDNNRKLSVYTRRNILILYRYLEIIGAPTKLTPSSQRSNNFCP